MLRSIERRRRRATAIVLVALSALAVLTSAGAAAPDLAAATRSTLPTGFEYGTGAVLRVKGVELDRRFGRAWLIVRLTGEGHLRTAGSRVKAFAPRSELEPGLVRIPLIPKIRVAKELRREGSAVVTVSIYFRAKEATETEFRRRRVKLVRGGGE